MPDYKEMYAHLFRETTKAIFILQKAQQQTEDMYLADDTALLVLTTDNEKDDKN